MAAECLLLVDGSETGVDGCPQIDCIVGGWFGNGS
jgi:hypothetical protein